MKLDWKCWIGLHQWVYLSGDGREHEERECALCHKHQVCEDCDDGAFIFPVWFTINKRDL
jgi:hypothetical protein